MDSDFFDQPLVLNVSEINVPDHPLKCRHFCLRPFTFCVHQRAAAAERKVDQMKGRLEISRNNYPEIFQSSSKKSGIFLIYFFCEPRATIYLLCPPPEGSSGRARGRSDEGAAGVGHPEPTPGGGDAQGSGHGGGDQHTEAVQSRGGARGQGEGGQWVTGVMGSVGHGGK